jgi:hypothetical protein
VIFFLPVNIPHKLALPVFTLFVAGLWLIPWQMALAMLFSALGDYMGSCGNVIGQMGFFALAHVWIIIYFIRRYINKVEPDGKLTVQTPQYYDVGNYIYGFTKGTTTGAPVAAPVVFDANLGELTHNESNYCIIDGAYTGIDAYAGGFEFYYGMTAKRVGQ